MKKTLSAIATAVLAATVGFAQPGCAYLQKHDAGITTAVETRDANVRRTLDEILHSVYCVKTKSEYREIGAAADSPTRTVTGFGTAFAYAYKGGDTYLVTNVHVLSNEEFVSSADFGEDEFGLPDLDVKLYIKVSEKTSLSGCVLDEDESDDIPIYEVAKDEDKDVAVVKAHKQLYASESYIRDTKISLQPGDEVFLFGYPRSLLPVVTKGSVAHPDYVALLPEPIDVLDINSTFGNSGSPYFVRRGGELYWAGILGKTVPYKDSNVTLLGLGTPIKSFDGLLENHVQKEKPKR